jgi:hypothetical protein
MGFVFEASRIQRDSWFTGDHGGLGDQDDDEMKIWA